jgi:cobalt-zinc-cadmium efflux system outer membrane protein
MTARQSPPNIRASRPPTAARGIAAAFASAAFLILAGCHTPAGCDRPDVAGDVAARFGTSPNPASKALPPGRAIIPDGLAAGAPMNEEQAVLLALWNNAFFLESLAEIDLTRADLVQAGLLPNPEFLYYWSAPNKPFRYLLDFPLEALYLRPIRVKAAAAENERACAKLTQLGLDLIRDTRQAYADLKLAHDRMAVAQQAVDLRSSVVKFAETRLKAGDASPLEVSTARIDALRVEQDLIRSRYDVNAAEERLRNLTGLSDFTGPLVPEKDVFDPRLEIPVEELTAEAVRTRPDALAADHAARAASERVRFARLGWFRFLGILDATTGRATGHEFGPALRVTVPIFNRNQGGIARAEAEFEQLDRRRQTTHNLIVMDVRTAFARYQQARSELDFLAAKTRPEVDTAIRRVEAAYQKGNITYLLVLETQRQLIDTYAREAQLRADLRRAWAELERSTGRRLTPPEPPR